MNNPIRKPMSSLRRKQVIVGCYLVVLLLAVGNRFLEWNLFGTADRWLFAIVVLIGVVGMLRFMPKMLEEIYAHQAALKALEDAKELGRDKSGDVAEAERMRRAIGMPPDTSLERTREG
jgi:uncharacterized membrane protein YcjF (UPF0283 family)